jgi:predicted DNA binding CopG/RHH family protein
VQVIGEKGGKFMKKKQNKLKYTNEPLGKIKIVDDFLPKPKDLVLKEETTKITISLTKSSIDFFKSEAEKHHTHYQTMIRALIDQYTSHYI